MLSLSAVFTDHVRDLVSDWPWSAAAALSGAAPVATRGAAPRSAGTLLLFVFLLLLPFILLCLFLFLAIFFYSITLTEIQSNYTKLIPDLTTFDSVWIVFKSKDQVHTLCSPLGSGAYPVLTSGVRFLPCVDLWGQVLTLCWPLGSGSYPVLTSGVRFLPCVDLWGQVLTLCWPLGL